VEASWAKVKFDRQIVAIAKVTGASIIYSDDEDVAKLAQPVGIEVIALNALPEPPTPPQIEMDLAPKETLSNSDTEES